MPIRSPEASQRLAGRIAGFTLLLLIASGLCGMFVFQRNLEVVGDAVATARNLLAHERAYRVGIVCEIVMFNCDIVLALALYALLKPVNETLALLGAFWRVANAIVLAAGVAAILTALHTVSGASGLSVFSSDQLAALMNILLNVHSNASRMGLLFFSLGAGMHSYLLLQSRYIPRILSGAYLVVAILLLGFDFGWLIVPQFARRLEAPVVVPDLVVELAVASWLAFKGVRIGSSESGPVKG